MLKRTLAFQNPCYLKCNLEQLVVSYKGIPGYDTLADKTVPLEDVGVIILEHQQITLTHFLIARCMYYNIALICCDATHHPTGLMLNLNGNTTQSEKFKWQIAASEPLKKQLWQQIISSKITNQAAVFKHIGLDGYTLKFYAADVKSGDTTNAEGSAAAYYWQRVFVHLPKFYRRREGEPPNNMLNYGYAIIRAITARALVGAGLMPTLGVWHRNRYNAYCLADDLMEPYRPFVDKTVINITNTTANYTQLTPDIKKTLLSIPQIDVTIDGQTSPLFNAIQKSAYSLAKCFEGTTRKLTLPIL